MATDPIVFAMANPDPEIRPELIQDVAAVIATGRSDFPNQINNVLAFPGIFRGALDAGARRITENMKVAAADAIAADGAAATSWPRLHHPVGVRPRRGRARGPGQRGGRRGRRRLPVSATRRVAVTFDFWNTLVGRDRGRDPSSASLGRGAVDATGCRPAPNRWPPPWRPAGTGSTNGGGPTSRSAPVRRSSPRSTTSRWRCPTTRWTPWPRSSSWARTRPTCGLAPNVGDSLRALAGAGVRIGIICDVGLTPSATLRRYLDHHGLLGYFDHWSFSDEVGWYKPDARDLRPRPRRARAGSTRPAPRTSATCAAPTSPGRGAWAGPRALPGPGRRRRRTGRGRPRGGRPRRPAGRPRTLTCRPPSPADLPADPGPRSRKRQEPLPGQGFRSGRDRRRSGDLPLFRRSLCQLSYPTVLRTHRRAGGCEVAVPTGFEPATSGLTGRRALQTAPRDHELHCCTARLALPSSC